MKIEFIIPTYNRPAHLSAILWSLRAQTSPDWTAHVVADCPADGVIEPVIAMFADEPRIRFTVLLERHNDFGHTPRNVGLMTATEDLVCMTGEDNYYMPTFVEEVTAAARNEAVNLIFTDFVHNWGKEYVYVPSLLFWSHIDIGNTVFRTVNACKMKLNPAHFSADWEMIETYLKIFPGKPFHIKKVLFVHN
jgi:glycosyltransferase involved in cell wall biosynthesis